MSFRGTRHEVGTSIAGELRAEADAGQGASRRLAKLEVRLAPIARLVGNGLAGFGVVGLRGAGTALMLPATAVFVAELVDPSDDPVGHRRSGRNEGTLRHRYFLWLDRRRWRRESQRGRQERRAAERYFLEREKHGGR